ncbi:Taurine catabolism dioxygenase TauD, TfdA family [Enhydrobacter aerosaccus]|uniref:Taurine catabolism dioxygenase TauD, TfdA family n=1 Tax=Enhydrobacter aerosaccus TaxID=225324 RepID=A0A1T4MQX6_9HYPH|nr:TauD/TfdA family dioxygenase [Enhydrobacter aerosaccus]SJZ69271.1 Taurine catabolism dioxygenase TauD, TfdA family [Enhydrobacter aerosaccus]
MTRLAEPVRDGSAWTVQELRHDPSWIHNLTAAEIEELDQALRHVNEAGLGMTDIAREDFVLPRLGQFLATVPEAVENGRGFVVLRGIPVERYSDEDASRLFYGLGTHIGPAISQNAHGDLLTKVTDRKVGSWGEPTVRGYQTRTGLGFHTDNADAVALLVVRRAKEGGTSLLSSATAIYNEILTHHPEHLDRLHRGYVYHLRGEGPAALNNLSHQPIPIFSYYAGRLSCRYVRASIELGAELSGQPLTAEDVALLDLIDELASREDLCLQEDFESGDVQIVSNHSILHARTAFEDFEEVSRKRLLLRLWFNLPNGRPLAPDFADRFGPGSARLGIPAVADATNFVPRG